MGNASGFPISFSIMLPPSQETSCHDQARQTSGLGNICAGAGSRGVLEQILCVGPVDDEKIIGVGRAAGKIEIAVGVTGILILIQKGGVDELEVQVVDLAVEIRIAI